MSADLRLAPIDLAHEPAFALGGVEVRPAKLEVVARERREVLEPRIMQVLVALARQRGEVVSREDLIGSCWAGRIVGDDAINRCIFRLRRLAGQIGGFEVETVPRVGYRLTETGPDARGRRRVLTWIAAGLGIVVLIAGAAGWWVMRRTVVLEPPRAPRVAVAGFRPLSDDPAARAFSTTLADDAAGVLGDHALAVDRPKSEADMVLGGSVVRDGSGWRVRAQLEDALSGFVLWSQDFEGPVGKENALGDQVTTALADSVFFAMDPLRQPGLKVDPRSVALYIRAAKMSTNPDPKNSGQAELLLSEAVARTPNFAGARLFLAEELSDAYRTAQEPQKSALRERAVREANEAVRLDPDSGGDAYDALYMLARVDHPKEIVAAEDVLLKGLAAAPDAPWIRMRECRLLLEVGRAREALRYCEQARAMRPLTPPIDWPYAQALDAAGERDRALQAVEETARYHPDHMGSRAQRFEMAAFRGFPDRARALLPDITRPPELMDEKAAAGVALFLQALKSHAPEDADRAIAEMWSAARVLDNPRWIIFAAATLQRPDDAFKAMDELGVLPGRTEIGLVTGNLLDPSAAPLRSDPRFWREAAKAGYLDYWRTRGAWPDFCYDPKLPFDCRKLAAQATPRS